MLLKNRNASPEKTNRRLRLKNRMQHASRARHPFPFASRATFFLSEVRVEFFYSDATYKLITERAHNLLLGTLSALLLLFFFFVISYHSFVFVCGSDVVVQWRKRSRSIDYVCGDRCCIVPECTLRRSRRNR